ncbi:MAG TPA: helix-turn-helix domain-containing protein, partial [bacterium]|nr:helix-turn-helix domain-containing protein [bacterium]
YSWPGNIRELSNVLERAIILCDEETIRPSHIFLTQQQSKTENEMQLVDMEIRHIKTILIKTRGKIAGRGGAAELLGINRSTLISKMKKLNIDHRQLSS